MYFFDFLTLLATFIMDILSTNEFDSISMVMDRRRRIHLGIEMRDVSIEVLNAMKLDISTNELERLRRLYRKDLSHAQFYQEQRSDQV
jgi:hypothetical protein